MDVPRRELAAVFAGGALGTLGRALLADAWATPAGAWPWATFAVNIAGALLLGWVATVSRRAVADPTAWRAFAGPGLCGALTTFSAFQLELLRLLDDSRVGLALAYAAASIAAGLLAVRAGAHLARSGRRA